MDFSASKFIKNYDLRSLIRLPILFVQSGIQKFKPNHFFLNFTSSTFRYTHRL